MIRVYDDTKVFVQCPAGACTGGAELLHQIVDYLNNNGVRAYMVYFGGGNKEIPNDYKKYNILVADEVSDNPHDISILYEANFFQVADKTKIQKFLWWLSVDNYFGSGSRIAIKDYLRFNFTLGVNRFVKRLGRLVLKRENGFNKSISLKRMSSLDVVCGYQSEYAHHFLINNGFKEMVPLKDYINVDHCKKIVTKGREDIVLYNPKKGYEYTSQLIKMAPDINWVPIINMSRAQVIEIMQKSKVYIDFGNHPGKDRLPRECAMNGLCIITGRRGSANFFEDVWIENKYKFDEKIANKKLIIETIKITLRNYEEAIDDFAFYRHKISLEKTEFENQIDEIFGFNHI